MGSVPVPVIIKIYGFSSLSLLVMAIVAVLVPAEIGVKRTVKVVLPPPEATGEEGCAWIENCPGSVPLGVSGVVNVKLALPMFVITNTKSVFVPSSWLPNP